MYRVSRVDNALKKHDRAWLRASPLKSGRSGTRDKEREKVEGKYRGREEE